MTKTIKYYVLGEGRVPYKYRVKGVMRYSTTFGKIFGGTFKSLDSAKKKVLELKKNVKIEKITITELNPEGGYYYKTGRQARSGYYYGEPKTHYEYTKKEIFTWRR